MLGSNGFENKKMSMSKVTKKKHFFKDNGGGLEIFYRQGLLRITLINLSRPNASLDGTFTSQSSDLGKLHALLPNRSRLNSTLEAI